MRSTWFSRTARVALLVVFGATSVSASAAAKPRPGRPRAMNLFASSGLFFQVNRQGCGIENTGQVCVAFAGSPVGGGSFWPKGTPDQYIFNSGLQLAGIVDRASPFDWAGDTVGYLFFNASGGDGGEPLEFVYDRLNPADVAAWPNGAVVRDTSIYNASLIGLPAISQGDAWTRYWEGDPGLGAGREHPMGIAVDMRALAWNYPTGNEDIIYFIFTFYNVTARCAPRGSSCTSAVGTPYANPTIPAQIQTEIAAIGDRFQNENEDVFRVQIPDGGYAIDSMYAAFGMDADVANFNQNYASAILPFDLGLTYTGTWLPDPGWVFPADMFGSPFHPAPGFVGVKYLKAPSPLGLTMFSQHFNPNVGFGLLDPNDVRQLARYLSGFFGPSDTPCSVGSPPVARARKLCYLGQVQGDARFFQSSGPFDLAPGEARSIVVAYINAAPVREHVLPHVGGNLAPGVPATDSAIFVDRGLIRPIERIAGWVSEFDSNGNARIDQSEVTTVPRSLLNKALIAQDVFNSGFLLPFSPERPEFFLIPGNNQVTVVWQRSPSETTGDPFFSVASDPASSLFDQNFRKFDVEGYRVYRGRSSSQLELVAQFDYDDREFTDFTGAVSYPDADGDGLFECAPELGVTGDCPAFPNDIDLVGNLIQVPAGQRVQLANGGVIVLQADTAVVNTLCGPIERCPPLENTGVGFAYVDTEVRNSFTYFYAVTAFDVNSLKSGPTSLESPRVPKRVTPRGNVPNQRLAGLTFGIFGDDGTELTSPTGTWDIDSATGRFTGPPPPTAVTQLAATFAPLVEQLLPPLSLEFVIDSVHGITEGDRAACGEGVKNIQEVCGEFFVTFTRGATSQRFSAVVPWPIWEGFATDAGIGIPRALLGAFPVAADSASAAAFGVPSGFAQFDAAVEATFNRYIRYSAHEGQQSRRLRTISGTIGASPGGSRWFDGADETLADPAYGLRAGRLTGVDTIFAPLSHVDIDPATPGAQAYEDVATPFNDAGGNSIRTIMQCYAYAVAMLGRQADIEVTWGTGGTIASVRDVTHRVNVPFRAVPDGSYGFFGDNNGNLKIDWRDFDRIEKVAQVNANLGFCAGTDPGPGNRSLLVQNPVIMDVSTAGAAGPAGTLASMPTTGTGFGMYINGQIFIFQLSGGTAPAAGTKWTLRSYAGTVNASAGTRATTNPDAYVYTPIPGSPAIPGLRIVFTVPSATTITPEDATTLANVHTVPDPYYVTSSLEFTANQKILKFVNLPRQAIIRIYSLSGVLVAVVTHNDAGLGGEATWNLRNRNNQFVASGVYFYHVETPSGQTKVGRFTIVNFAP